MHSSFGTVNPELRVTLLEALHIITNQEWHLRQEPPPPIPPSGLFDIPPQTGHTHPGHPRAVPVTARRCTAA
jgi:hypothetical protein